MRAVKVSLPAEYADAVRELAFESGIGSISFTTTRHFRSSGEVEERADLSCDTSTPRAKVFVDKVLSADFFDPKTCTLVSRERRAIVGSEPLEEITYPWIAPGIDVCQELFLFSHVTWGLAGRVLLAGGMLSYGLMHANLLLMIAGMMFLPLLPIMSGIGFSASVYEWRFAARATAALVLTIGLLFVSGLAVGAVSGPPIRFNEFAPVYVSVLISLAVGLASGLGMTDDGGRREMIGLAATAQIAIIPSWLGLVVSHGATASATTEEIATRLLTLVLNIGCVIAGSLFIYVLTKAAHPSLRKLGTR